MALSSGEAAYCSLVRAALEGLGVQALAHDLGWKCLVVVPTDSPAIAGRGESVGRGSDWAHRLPHVVGARGFETSALPPWAETPADPLTNPHCAAELVAQ